MADKVPLETGEQPPSYDDIANFGYQEEKTGLTSQPYGLAGQQHMRVGQIIYPPQGTLQNIYAPQGIPQNIYPPQGIPQHVPHLHGYGTTCVVITHQPGAVVFSAPPKDHMALAIVTTILCCVPLGVFAILKANKSRVAVASGDYETAHVNAAKAKRYSIYGIITGSVLLVLVSILMVLV